MGKKSAATASAPKSSSAPTKSTSKVVGSSSTSSILKSAFAPSYLQLHLFASVIQSFESQQLRIHDTTNGRLRQQHPIPTGVEVTCLDWGRYGPAYRQSLKPSNKKRKRADGLEDVVVAYGTKTADICLYSPSRGEIVSTLSGAPYTEVADFKFDPADNLEAWSLGNGKLVKWDLTKDTIISTVDVDKSVRTISTPSQSTSPTLICASETPYAITADDSENVVNIESLDAFNHQVTVLFRSISGAQELLLAADDGRFLNLYDVAKNKIVRTLVVGGEIAHASLSQPVNDEDQILAVTTREGAIELFTNPFALPVSINGDIKSQRKQMTRKSNATIRLISAAGSKDGIHASDAYISGPNIVILSTESGVEPMFQKVRWQDEGNGQLLFGGIKEVPRVKSQSTTNSATLNGTKDMGQTKMNDARAVVANGIPETGSQQAPLEIDDSDEEEVDEDEPEAAHDASESATGSDADSDEEMEDAAEDIADAEDETAEPSFGEQLALRHPETISIADVVQADSKSLARIPPSKQLVLPSGMSLGTVLTQSLRTNDQTLLETCLHVTDEKIIRNTILRLDSSLAANLLTKLAERLADRPGRYGHLLTWVQSTMIAHGGAIASQADVASKLRTLYTVLNERSKVLPSILTLKGKLDMMSAQQSFRQEQLNHSTKSTEGPRVIMIQGQDNWSSDEEIDEAPVAKKSKKNKAPKKDLAALVAHPESSDDEDNDVPMVNGEYHTDEDEASEGEEIQRNGIIDDEAEESDDGEEGSDDDSSSGSEEEEDDDEEDSEMDDFINDGEISVEDDDGILDDEPVSKKKSKHR